MAAATVVALLGIAVLAIYDLRVAARDHALKSMANLSLTLERDLLGVTHFVDQALKATINSAKLSGFEDLAPNIKDALLFDAEESPFKMGLIVTDEAGKVKYARTPNPGTLAFDFSARDYFIAHKTRPDLGLVVSEPSRTARNKVWVVNLSRRLNHADGSFAGLVVAGIPQLYFQDLLSHLQLGAKATAYVVSGGGRMIAREPFPPSDIGTDVSKSRVFQELAKGDEGTFEVLAAIDGVERLNTYRRAGNLPLIVAVALATDDIYADWRQKASALAIALTVLFMTLAVLGRALLREFRARGQAERQAWRRPRTNGRRSRGSTPYSTIRLTRFTCFASSRTDASCSSGRTPAGRTRWACRRTRSPRPIRSPFCRHPSPNRYTSLDRLRGAKAPPPAWRKSAHSDIPIPMLAEAVSRIGRVPWRRS